MDSIKWKCKNWIFCFRKLDNFHKLDLINFHPNFFSIVITDFTLMCEISRRFLKKQRWKYYREKRQKKDKMLKEF